MCGINGIYGLNSEEAKQRVQKMNFCLSHRGPDDEGVFSSGSCTLGHRRLSIIDLSSAGHQPMHSYDNRYSIVYNGELYNYKQLRLELSRSARNSSGQAINVYPFQTQTDTEVIIAAYARWGKECLNKFNGMYAFAIWDDQRKELFIARDRLGIKPLYYYKRDGIVAFSSEIRSLLQTGLVERKLNQNGLVDYLRYQTVHAPATIVKDIFMLLPGHHITINESQCKIEEYWRLPSFLDPSIAGKEYSEIKTDIRNLLFQAVERRLIADVPFGAFLSGGIDSSAIVALMSEVQAGKVKTFSVVFDESEFSEAKYAQLVARKYQTEHHEIKLNVEDFLNDLPSALRAMDHPSGDGPNSYVVSKATKKAGITMALSGLGGDELFAGYDIFKRAVQLKKDQWINIAPVYLRAAVGKALTIFKPGIQSAKMAELIKQERLDFYHTYHLSRQVLLDQQVQKLFQQKLLSENAVKTILLDLQLQTKGQRKNPLPFLSKVSAAEISTYMQNVLLRDTDQMSMTHALEVRVPFLDYQLVEYVMSVPDKYKYPSSPKKLLVDALGDLLPSEIVNRPKMGFTFPWKHWLKNELKSFCEQRISSLSKRSYFNESGVRQLWADFLKDDPRVSWSRVWHLVVLESWMQQNQIE